MALLEFTLEMAITLATAIFMIVGLLMIFAFAWIIIVRDDQPNIKEIILVCTIWSLFTIIWFICMSRIEIVGV